MSLPLILLLPLLSLWFCLCVPLSLSSFFRVSVGAFVHICTCAYVPPGAARTYSYPSAPAPPNPGTDSTWCVVDGFLLYGSLFVSPPLLLSHALALADHRIPSAPLRCTPVAPSQTLVPPLLLYPASHRQVPDTVSLAGLRKRHVPFVSLEAFYTAAFGDGSDGLLQQVSVYLCIPCCAYACLLV